MSQAIHVDDNHWRRTHLFECPLCAARQEITSEVWRRVEVLGEKPTLDACEHRPHIPPSPLAVVRFERGETLRRIDSALTGKRPAV